MDESKPPGDNPIVPLEYRSARSAAAHKAVQSMPVIPTGDHHHPYFHRDRSVATQLKWILGVLVLLAIGALAVHSYDSPRRALARRGECAANMKTIGAACIAFADEHEGKFPASIEELLDSTGVTSDIFVCPATYDTPAEGSSAEQIAAISAGGHVSYIWLGKELSRNSPSDAVLAYEPLANHNNAGIHVLFSDYHVEWLDQPDAQKLIDSIVSGDPTIWPAAGTKP